MKVLHYFLAAVVGVLPSSSVLAGNAHHVRGRDASAVAAGHAPPDEEGRDGPEGHGRSATACGPLSCSTDLHFCTTSMFSNDRCDSYSSDSFYAYLFEGGGSFCATTDPTVLVQAHLGNCVGQIGTVTFDMFKDGTKVRHYGEKQYPYTVFGDTTSPFTVNSRVLGVGTYVLNVLIKDPNGCVMERLSYNFDIVQC